MFRIMHAHPSEFFWMCPVYYGPFHITHLHVDKTYPFILLIFVIMIGSNLLMQYSTSILSNVQIYIHNSHSNSQFSANYPPQKTL